MGAVTAEFDVKKDERNRVTLKGVQFDHYHAKVFDDGHIEFYPQILSNAALSVRTLEMMDTAVANLSRGKTGSAMDPRAILDATDDDE